MIDPSQLFTRDEDGWSNLIGSFIINFSCCEELVKIISNEYIEVNKLSRANTFDDHISNFRLSILENCSELDLTSKLELTADRLKKIKSVRDTLAHNSLSILTNENDQGVVLKAELILADKRGKVALTLHEFEQKVNEMKCIRRGVEDLYKRSLCRHG